MCLGLGLSSGDCVHIGADPIRTSGAPDHFTMRLAASRCHWTHPLRAATERQPWNHPAVPVRLHIPLGGRNVAAARVREEGPVVCKSYER